MSIRKHHRRSISRAFILTASLVSVGNLHAQDSELTNYKSGIDVTWGGTKGVDYCEEYFYHDKLIDDHKVVHIRSTTPISMAHNARNTAIYGSVAGGRKFIGAKDPYPQTPGRLINLLSLNSRWPNAVANGLAYVQSLPSSNNESDDKGMDVFAFAWYDDQNSGPIIPPSDAVITITVTDP